jgi:hypothetical protein
MGGRLFNGRPKALPHRWSVWWVTCSCVFKNRFHTSASPFRPRSPPSGPAGLFARHKTAITPKTFCITETHTHTHTHTPLGGARATAAGLPRRRAARVRGARRGVLGSQRRVAPQICGRSAISARAGAPSANAAFCSWLLARGTPAPAHTPGGVSRRISRVTSARVPPAPACCDGTGRGCWPDAAHHRAAPTVRGELGGGDGGLDERDGRASTAARRNTAGAGGRLGGRVAVSHIPRIVAPENNWLQRTISLLQI